MTLVITIQKGFNKDTMFDFIANKLFDFGERLWENRLCHKSRDVLKYADGKNSMRLRHDLQIFIHTPYGHLTTLGTWEELTQTVNWLFKKGYITNLLNPHVFNGSEPDHVSTHFTEKAEKKWDELRRR